MRPLAMALVMGTACLATGCNKQPENPAPEAATAGGQAAAADEYFTVRAGPVANAKISSLAGEFQLLKVSQAQGIPSDGRGGACIVFAAADLGYPQMAAKACTTNASCVTGENGNDGTPASATYCDGKTKTCWARPGNDPAGNATCNRPVLMSPTVLNPTPKVPLDGTTLGLAQGTKLRVVACLNKGAPPYPVPGPGCAQPDSPDRIEVFGPVATIHP